MCFCRKFENSKWPPFFRRENLFEIWAEYLVKIPWGSKISTKSPYLAPLRRYKQLGVFAENSKIQNGCHFFGRQNFFEIWAEYLAKIPWGSKILTKSLYLALLRRYRQFCVFAENLKIQNAHHLLKHKKCLKIGQSMLIRTPGDRKLQQNCSILHR